MKDPPSRLLSWRLHLKAYIYVIEYKRGKDNTAADALSRMHPINHHADSSESSIEEVENKIEDDNPDFKEEITENVYIDSEKTNTNNEPLEAVEEVEQPIAKRLRNYERKDEKKIFNEYSSWEVNRRPSRIKIKTTAAGKHWIKIMQEKYFLDTANSTARL